MRRRVLAAFVLAALLVGALPAAAQRAAIVVEGEDGTERALTLADLEALPAEAVTLPAGVGHGANAPRRFEGPRLWTVLVLAGVADPAAPRDHLRQVVRLVGRDGYVALLAMGEISPEFENKPVILALRVGNGNGAPAADAPRIVVPGDRRAGRGVRDLARVAVSAPATTR